MGFTTTPRETAAEVLRRGGIEDLAVVGVRALHGGMIDRVELWETDGAPEALVCKRSGETDPAGLRHQAKALRWMKEHTEFPVPEVYALVSPEEGDAGTYLLLERLAGRNLAEARLSPAGMDAVEHQMAEQVGTLHSLRGQKYGSAVDGDRCDTWLEWFGPRFGSNCRDASRRLSPEARATCERLLSELPDWLPEDSAPTVVHGDLWHTNIMVDDADPRQPRITGYIDGGALLADPEYELSFMLAFGTVGERFLRYYSERQTIRPGFGRRCLIYWLNTMLLHVWLFGPGYLDRTERISREIAEIA